MDCSREKHCPLSSSCVAESVRWPLDPFSSDGPRPESCNDAHLWTTHGEDKAANHLLQCVSDSLQLRGMKGGRDFLIMCVSFWTLASNTVCIRKHKEETKSDNCRHLLCWTVWQRDINLFIHHAAGTHFLFGDMKQPAWHKTLHVRVKTWIKISVLVCGLASSNLSSGLQEVNVNQCNVLWFDGKMSVCVKYSEGLRLCERFKWAISCLDVVLSPNLLLPVNSNLFNCWLYCPPVAAPHRHFVCSLENPYKPHVHLCECRVIADKWWASYKPFLSAAHESMKVKGKMTCGVVWSSSGPAHGSSLLRCFFPELHVVVLS